MNEEKIAPPQNILIGPSEKPGFHLEVKTNVNLPAPQPKSIEKEIAQFWQQRRVEFLDSHQLI